MREHPPPKPDIRQIAREEAEAAVARHTKNETDKLVPSLADPRLATMDFGTLLRYFRLRKGLSAAALARLLHMDPSVISHFEAGRRHPSPRRFHSIMRHLDLSPVERGLFETELMKRLVGRQDARRPKTPEEREAAQRTVASTMRLLLGYMLGLPANVSLYRATRVAKDLQETSSALKLPPHPVVEAMACGPNPAVASSLAPLDSSAAWMGDGLQGQALRDMILLESILGLMGAPSPSPGRASAEATNMAQDDATIDEELYRRFRPEGGPSNPA